VTNTIDTGKLGVAAANMMEAIENAYGERENSSLVDVIVVAAIESYQDSNGVPHDGMVSVHFATSSPRFYENIGLLRAALKELEAHA
jgi:hypothetical protein